MDNNEINSLNTEDTSNKVPGDSAQPRPKPLRKLVRVNPNGSYKPRHEAPPGERQEPYTDASGEYHGRYEAGTPGYYMSLEEYQGQHDPSVDDYMSQYGREEYVLRAGGKGKKKKQDKNKYKVQNIVTKICSIALTVVLIFTLVLNMPICTDRKTGKNVSIIRLIKTWQPAAKEGELDKSDIQNTVSDQITSDEDFDDGLDLPQLVEGQYSVLFLGFEPDEYNTDVMWVLQFDIGHGGLNILQIPRDTCLPDYTSSAARKFNSIYTLGDPSINPPIQRTVNAVQENFGIPIDAYVTTTCPDIVEIIDIIGGVPIHLDNAIDFEPSAPGTQFIPAGDIVLSGKQSEWFIRYRSGWAQGDIGRMQNQRRFMAAAMRKLQNVVEDEGKLKLYSYIKEIFEKDLLYTDMSLEDMSKLADFASTISMEDARVNMVPGEDAILYAEDGNQYSVYSVHKRATIDLLNEYYRPYQRNMIWEETSIVELVTDYEYNILDDTSETLEDLEGSAEPIRKH